MALRDTARRVRLRRSETSAPGISRRRRGKGFSYHSPSGTLIDDAAEIQRLRGLAIPPAWHDVWICPYPNGHIQATGFDDADRKQYIYHPHWQDKQAERKFDHVLDVGDALPGARPKITHLLRGDATGRDMACAIAFRLLDTTGIRVGNEEYADQNGSYGLTTMLVRHLDLDGDDLQLSFPAKSGQQVNTGVRDADLAAAIGPLLSRPKSHTALAYRHEGEWRTLSSDEVNDFLRHVSGVEMTAKDFRTWHATVIAARALAKHDPAEITTKKEHQRAIRETVEQVAEHLQNTPTIARNSYIDPRVFDRFEAGEILRTNTYRQAERGLRDFLTA